MQDVKSSNPYEVDEDSSKFSGFTGWDAFRNTGFTCLLHLLYLLGGGVGEEPMKVLSGCEICVFGEQFPSVGPV